MLVIRNISAGVKEEGDPILHQACTMLDGTSLNHNSDGA